MKKLLLRLAADGYFDRVSGGPLPPKSSQEPPAPKNKPGYILHVFTPNHPESTHDSFHEDLSQQDGAASVAARKLRPALEGEALQAVDTILNEIAEQAALRITQEQASQIDAILKKWPVTTNLLAEIWEHDETSGSSYRQRADVVSFPIETTGHLPIGQVFRQIGTTTYYIEWEWDNMGSSTLHYYGPFYDSDSPADARIPS